jgi:acyl-CoA synthetase (AMP-forming)/AMP-acid ligase II
VTTRLALSFLREGALEMPDAPAIITVDGESLSYGVFLDRVRASAGWLKAQGVRSGDKVALYCEDAQELLTLLFGIWGSGAIALPLNISLPMEKLSALEHKAKPNLAVTGPGVTLSGARDFPVFSFPPEVEMEPAALCSAGPNEVAIIMFTSGTSGLPKAVPITHGALARNAIDTAKRLEITASDRILVNSPPYYTSPIVHHLTLMSQGGSTVSSKGFLFGAKLLELINEYRCSGFGGVPVHFTRILAALEEGTSVSSDLRFLMNSGEHLPGPILKAICAAIPKLDFYCVYGLTEVAGRLCILDPKFTTNKSGSVGRPIGDMQVTVRNDDGHVLPAGERGQVYVTGPNLMSGYVDAPQINAKLMTPNGFASGDIGFKDEDGFLFLDGRRDDIIKVGGEKVSIRLIEEAVFGFEGIADHIVTPVYDKHLGMVPALYYVAKAEQALNRKVLRKKLKTTLPANHVPTKFEEVSEIPRSTSGKLDRAAFLKRLGEQR